MRALPLVLTAGLAAACAPERSCTTELWYVDDGAAGQVAVVGDWTDWRPEEMERYADGAWRLEVDLPAGDYAYALEVGGHRILDPYQPLLTEHPVSGDEQSLLRVEACDTPLLEVDRLAATGTGEVRVSATFLRLPGGPRLDETTVSASIDGEPFPAESDPSTGSLTASTAGLAPGKHWLTLTAADRAGATTTTEAPFWVEERPFSWDDGLLYQIMIDRFAGSSGGLPPVAPGSQGSRQGGTLQGVHDALEAGYFDALGVRALWLSPVFPNPDGQWPGMDGELYESYHGYWPVERSGVDPRLGTEADLDALVAAAHARGIRVLLDVIPNHVHIEHPWWAQQAGWFQGDGDCLCGAPDCSWAENIETCWFTDYMPDLDWSQPAVVDAVTGDLEALARRHDLDGLRVDAVPMVPRAAIRHVAHTVHQRFENGPTRFFLLGETFTGPGEVDDIRRNLGPHGLDGQFDFPMMWALRAFAAWGTEDAADLEAALRRSEAAWAGSGAVMSPFVGNHDVSRFLSEAAGHRTDAPWADPPPQPTDRAPYERLVLAQAVALTLPGMPVLWQGDELGLAGATDPDCRRTVPFGDDLTAHQAWTLDRVQRLGRARACMPALRRGERVPVLAQDTVYAHLRDVGDGRPALLVVNAGDTPATVSLDVPATLSSGHDLLGDGPVDLSAPLVLPARSAHLVVPPGSPCIEEVLP